MTEAYKGDLVALHAELREKVVARLQTCLGADVVNAVALFAGGKQTFWYDTDHECLFRQESNFHYVFGVNEPDLFGALDLETGESYLFIPRLGLDHAIWCGPVQPCEAYGKQYGLDHVYYVDEIATVLSDVLRVSTIHFLDGVNTDSGNSIEALGFNGIENYVLNGDHLYKEMMEARLIKTDRELDLMSHLNEVSSRAHVKVMQQCRPGMFEYQLESIFMAEASYHGNCRHVAYTCICGTGENGAVLHYGHAGAPNARQFGDGDMCLLDMGGEYHCYASDITCSFPSNGKFTTDQREIYTAVYRAQRAVEAAVKPGVEWSDMHRLAEKTIAESLLEFDFLRGSIEDLMENHIPALFMPHGLGHLIGKDTHDPGGYNSGRDRIDEPGIRNLRCNRILQEGMVLSNEPGVYFIRALLEPALDDPKKSQFLNRKKIVRFMSFGGVRLEDDIIVTADGCKNMTKVPRTIEEVERVMAGGEFEF